MGWDRVEWNERVALVTGGSRGIGRAVAIRLAAAGLAVAVNYRAGKAEADAVREAILAHGGRAECFPADVSQPSEAQALIDAVVRRWGRLDVLVNNAGITKDTLLLRMHDDDWERVLATDLGSVFWCTRAAAKTMVRARFGRIVNVASIAGLAGNAGQANYSAAKAGVIGFSRAVARELASRQITVNVVAPGLVETDITAGMKPAERDRLVASVPLGRMGKAEEIAEAVWFLAQADYITGQTLVVDGGLVMD